MMKHIATFLALAFLCSCAKKPELPAGLRAGGFKLADSRQQEMILQQMTELSIPFKINERGFVIYMQKDVAQVRGLRRKARYGDELTHKVIESTSFIDPNHRMLLIEKFEHQGIPYSLDSSSGLEHIMWLQLYGPKVDLIIQEVGFEHYEQATNK